MPGLTVHFADDVLHVDGELDVATAPALREACLRLLDGDGVTGLVVDASGIAFADSSGLAVLLMAAQRCAARGGRLVLRRASPALRRVVELAGAERAFEIED